MLRSVRIVKHKIRLQIVRIKGKVPTIRHTCTLDDVWTVVFVFVFVFVLCAYSLHTSRMQTNCSSILRGVVERLSLCFEESSGEGRHMTYRCFCSECDTL